MWSAKRSGGYFNLSLLFQNLWLFLSCHIFTVFAQCDIGLEPDCIWTHDPKSALVWHLKEGSEEDTFVELSDCKYPDCGIGLLQSPWLPARDRDAMATIEYKIYGTSSVYLRLNLKLEDALTPHQLFYKTGNYAYGYPKEWTAERVRIPATHTRYKLLIKAYVPYKEAMVAVKGINLEGGGHITSTGPSSAGTGSSSSTTSKSATPRTRSRTTSTSTATTTVRPDDDDRERTSDDAIIFPDDDDDDDDDTGRFQALEVQNFIGEEDLIKGYTTVVDPQICMYK